MNRPLPVTLVGGFLGAGKTSLLHHFISEQAGGHLAVLVENSGALNPDAKALRGLCGAMRRINDTVVEVPDLDDVRLVEWLGGKLREFWQAGRYERVLVEVSGTANAARLGRHFGLLPGDSSAFASWAELHHVITVVDALDFDRSGVASTRGTPGNPLAAFQREQIEGASLLVLNKCDLLEDAERESCTRRLRQINAVAPILETAYGEMPPELWRDRADPQALKFAVEIRTPSGSADRPMEIASDGPALGSLVYRAHRPFHPARFWDWFQAGHPGLLRVKGLVWLATRNLLVGGISRTRWQNSCGAAGFWWAALPREEWPQEPEALQQMQQNWREPYGDRRQELVLMGEAKELSQAARELNGCLLSAEEYERPLAEWKALPDPFPAWDLDES